MKIAIIGFGGVGQALAELLHKRREYLIETEALNPVIVAVTDVNKGAVYDPKGLDIEKLKAVLNETGLVESYPMNERVTKGLDSFQTIKQTNADTIIEVTYTNVQTGQPAIDHCRMAFENKKNVITTNKGPVALAYNELSQLAKENNVFWGFEGTVMSGTPALRMPVTSLTGNEVKEIIGILNGTTNYMLTEMEKGKSYDEALKKAQQLGYAEADPTSDVEGYDAMYKAVILANHVMGTKVDLTKMETNGITSITNELIEQAALERKKWRFITRIKKDGNSVKVTVKPEKLDKNHPLANVTGATNAIIYNCDLAGPIMLTGAGAGLTETAYSLMIDLINFNKYSTSTINQHA
ncbi:homoserine dehydrogenase [Evansella halocellulosilytica]|uniref:homoserine dehydrogenase n=1 Tax=Evansella halocellulosilytica TaxID=2011013 RepID=UPI000BB6D844|nr:homoserine dehydrogenase [Evansella halocellulosilytica]